MRGPLHRTCILLPLLALACSESNPGAPDRDDGGLQGDGGGLDAQPGADCAEGASEVEPCAVGERARFCSGGRWSAWTACGEGDACDGAGGDVVGCGDEGTLALDCVEGRLRPSGACEEPVPDEECVDGATQSLPCPEGGEHTRACIAGVWSDYTPCGGCSEGDTDTVTCGLNGRGTATATCDADGRWVAPETCADPDSCVDGEVGERACAEGGTVPQTCVEGAWQDDAPAAACSPDMGCEDGAERSTECGLNGRGSQSEICVGGEWALDGACEDRDECVDGAVDAQPCDGGQQERRRFCVDGRYTERTPCGECNDGDRRALDCGPEERGTAVSVCVAGAWAAPDGGCMGGGGDCVDGAERQVACGRNDRGVVTQVCADGQWDRQGGCDDPDVCEDGERDQTPCAGGGAQPRVCEAGQWVDTGPCGDPPPDRCDRGDRRDDPCGLNGRGQEPFVCVDGTFEVLEPCRDQDVCTDGDEARRTCDGGQGVSAVTCRQGQWVGGMDCDGECDAGQVEVVACGRNLRGTQRLTCEGGEFGPGPCDDPDVCDDGEERERDRECGEVREICVLGQWQEGICRD